MVIWNRTREVILSDPRLREAAMTLRVVAIISALVPLAGFTFGLNAVVIPFAALAMLGAAGARSDKAAWLAIVYVPIYHTLTFYSLVADRLVGSIPIIVGTFMWILYIQAFLFLKGYAELVTAEGNSALAPELGEPAASPSESLRGVWVRRAGLYAIPALVSYLLAMIPGVGAVLLVVLFVSVAGYGGYVYLKVAQ